MTVLVGNLSFQSMTNHYERPCMLIQGMLCKDKALQIQAVFINDQSDNRQDKSVHF